MGRARGARTVQEDTAAPKEDKRERQSGRKSLVAEDAASEGALALPLGLVLFAVVLVTYVRTAYPSVPGGDAGELVFTSCSLGIAHPPGVCWAPSLPHADAEAHFQISPSLPPSASACHP